LIPQQLAERWLERFNARDLDGLLALYADGAIHHSPKLRAQRPGTDGKIAGKQALRDWWADSFERLPQLHYRLIALTADPARAVLEYWRELPGETPLHVAEVFVCAAGKISESFVFHG